MGGQVKLTVFSGPRALPGQRGHRAASYGHHVTEMPKGVPPYQVIADSLRARIESNELPPGAMLPSITRISHEWGVPEITAGQALKLLHSEGLTRIAEGETFVAGPDD
jgi:DNA-binding GntR family transcriptional regulator